MKITRINPGIYDATVAGRTFEIEQYPDGSWLLFERVSALAGREFWNDFTTFRAAKAALATAALEF